MDNLVVSLEFNLPRISVKGTGILFLSKAYFWILLLDGKNPFLAQSYGKE